MARGIMAKKWYNYLLGAFNISMLFASTYLLNCCMTIYQCAFVFTVIALLMNTLTLSHGKSVSLKAIAFSVIITFALLWNTPYNIRPISKLAPVKQVQEAHGAQNRSVLNVHEDLSTGATQQLPTGVECPKRSIDGSIMYGLVIASFASLLASLYCAVCIFQKIHKKFGFIISNFISLLGAALIDGGIMMMYFYINSSFSHAHILDIATRELSYKIFYGLACGIIMRIAFIILKNHPGRFNWDHLSKKTIVSAPLNIAKAF